MIDAEFEAKSYYAGLPSKPILVYQTGTPWKKPANPAAYLVRKAVRPVFDHPIEDAWDELGPQVCNYLDSANVRWTSIDVVRFSNVRYGQLPVKADPGPPVLWIGVMPASLSREDAEVAAVGCEGLLAKFGLTDGAVEIAFRESVFTRSGGPRLFEYDYDLTKCDDTADVRGPLTPALGLHIAARDTPDVEGTGGLYIHDGTRVFVLTARHVVLPPDAVPNELYDHRDTQPRRDVLLLGRKAFQGLFKPIKDQIEEQEYELRKYRNNCAPEDCTQRTMDEELSELMWITQRTINALNGFHDDIKENWSAESQRVLGHIAYSSPISVVSGTKCFIEDWALIELDSKKIDWETFKGNVIDLGTSSVFLNKVSYFTDPKYKLNRLLPLQGIITDDELRHPTKLDRSGERGLFVTKRGNSTGETFGRTSGMMSFVREYFPSGKHETSVQLAIYPYLDPFHDSEAGAFSAPGDSGAIIADHNTRRILGLLIGGAGNTINIDVSYATPFYWLWGERIKMQFSNAELYECTDTNILRV